MAVLNIELTRRGAAAVTVTGLLVTFTDEKGVAHTIRSKDFGFGIRTSDKPVT